jgi:two-component system chemotaxis response regulator CheY
MTIEKKIRVVIIDDYDMTRMLLRIILNGDHYDVVGEASDGKEGVELCLELQPDLILLDVNMPVMNGLEALETIHSRLPEAIVLMVTGDSDVEMVNQAIKNGASGCIVKPFNAESVLQTLRQFS